MHCSLLIIAERRLSSSSGPCVPGGTVSKLLVRIFVVTRLSPQISTESTPIPMARRIAYLTQIRGRRSRRRKRSRRSCDARQAQDKNKVHRYVESRTFERIDVLVDRATQTMRMKRGRDLSRSRASAARDLTSVMRVRFQIATTGAIARAVQKIHGIDPTFRYAS